MVQRVSATSTIPHMGDGGGGHWLVGMDWSGAQPAGRCVCLS